jgi:tRNA(Leu) C34 or U34 (ribose-2'-O)-methylase TrmL
MARLDAVDARTLRALPKVYLPMDSAIRFYNLSSSVAMGFSEAWMQQQMS